MVHDVPLRRMKLFAKLIPAALCAQPYTLGTDDGTSTKTRPTPTGKRRVYNPCRWGYVIFVHQGCWMGEKYRRRVTHLVTHRVTHCVRSLVAVSLALLFSLASLTPLAALTPATRCASKTKCCCKKAHDTTGPALSSRSCGSNCGSVTLGGNGITVYAQPRTGPLSPVIVVAAGARPTQLFAHLLRPAASLRQRPPPSLPLE